MDFNKYSDTRRVNATAIFCYGILIFVLVASYLVEVLKKSRGEAEEDDHIVKLDFRQINYRFIRLLDKMQIPLCV